MLKIAQNSFQFDEFFLIFVFSLKFREQKQCKPFKWYLEHVYPQKFILDSDEHVFAYGRVRNEPSGLCIDTLQHDDKDAYNVGIYSCHAMVTSSQFFSFRYESHLANFDEFS